MLKRTQFNGFNHGTTSDITDRAVYERRRDILKKNRYWCCPRAYGRMGIPTCDDPDASPDSAARQTAGFGCPGVNRGRRDDSGKIDRLQGRQHLQQLL